MSIWDDPELRAGGEFVKLENKGDRISGVISAVRAHRFDDSSVVPQVIFVDDVSGEEKTWTAGQIQAKKQLADKRPEAGDWFSAELTDIEKRAGGKTLKHIRVEVRPGGGAPATPAANGNHTNGADSPAPAGMDPAQWAAMAPEQQQKIRAALGA